VMEKLLEDVSFDAGNASIAPGSPAIVIDAAFVEARLGALAANEDLARYVL